jgi:hypothetical protein
MKTSTRFMTKPVVVALAVSLGAASLSPSVGAADQPYTEDVSITQYSRWGDPAMARIAVDCGRALIRHLETARATLDVNQIGQARSALLASREFADAVTRVMPYLSVVDEIRDASKKVVKEEVEVFAADFLPIYASLDELAGYAPEATKESLNLVKHAEQRATQGDRAGAAKELNEARVDVTTVYLPVDYVEQQVRVAQNALEQDEPDVKVAKGAVQRALDSLVVVVDSVVQTAAK